MTSLLFWQGVFLFVGGLVLGSSLGIVQMCVLQVLADAEERAWKPEEE